MKNQISIIITEEISDVSREDLEIMSDYNMVPSYCGKDGAELMEKVQTLQPDIILMDMFMTRMDGVGVLRALNRQQLSKKPIVFVYSTFDSPVLKKEIMNNGAAYFVLRYPKCYKGKLLPGHRQYGDKNNRDTPPDRCSGTH